MTRTEQFLKTTEIKVRGGAIHWITLAVLIRNRVARIDEMLRPVPGYAGYGEEFEKVLRDERAALLTRLEAYRAEFAA